MIICVFRNYFELKQQIRLICIIQIKCKYCYICFINNMINTSYFNGWYQSNKMYLF